MLEEALEYQHRDSSHRLWITFAWRSRRGVLTALLTIIMWIAGGQACFMTGYFIVVVLQGSTAGAFAPPPMVPASISRTDSRCRSCCARASVDRPRRKQLRSRGWDAGRRPSTQLWSTDIESPFAKPEVADMDDDDDDECLPLTLENVEIVLDEMRPYLMSDG